MFTRLYFQSLCAHHCEKSPSNFTVKNFKGADQLISTIDVHTSASSIRAALKTFNTAQKGSSLSDEHCVAFGDGSTPVSADDFQLSGNNFTTYSGAYACVANADCTEATWTYTLTNTGSSEFTVREIGLYTSSSTSVLYSCLIMREVLDSPVTIPAGGVGQVTLTIKLTA